MNIIGDLHLTTKNQEKISGIKIERSVLNGSFIIEGQTTNYIKLINNQLKGELDIKNTIARVCLDISRDVYGATTINNIETGSVYMDMNIYNEGVSITNIKSSKVNNNVKVNGNPYIVKIKVDDLMKINTNSWNFYNVELIGDVDIDKLFQKNDDNSMLEDENRSFMMEIELKNSFLNGNMKFNSTDDKNQVEFYFKFINSIINGDFIFNDDSIQKMYLDLENVTFIGDTYIGNSSGWYSIYILNTIFSETADFSNSILSFLMTRPPDTNVIFNDSVFKKEAIFSNTVFVDGVKFRKVVFGGHADFRNANFYANADFRGAKFLSTKDFTGAILNGEPFNP